MLKNSKNKKIQNFILACLLAAVMIFIVSFGMTLKRSVEDSRSKDLKISVLIDEVGELYERVEEKDKELSEIYGTIVSTSGHIAEINSRINGAIQKNATEWETIKNELSLSNKQLTELVKEKEKVISELAISNQNLQRELDIPQHDPRILDVLIIGHNAKLTDTMILASVNPMKKKVTLISIPRDLYHKGRKINELYSKYGVGKLQEALAEITGIYPEKYVIFNFGSFVDLIDIMGGVEINVAEKLVDNAYPGPNHSYTKISFEPGLQRMDGSRALQYARSRKSTSDFDRAKRQQQVIEAVRTRVKELNVLLRLDLATKMYAKVQQNIETNINLFEGLSYLQHYQGFKIHGDKVLSTGNLLYSTKSGTGQYILLPRSKSYADIKEFVANVIN